MVTILAFIFVFSIIVFVHEFGHFITARIFKVRVEEFAFGFPPRIWTKKVGETVYGINLLPIGGYVKLFGEEGEDSKDPASLTSKKPWQKALIFAAGVIMNFVLAWVLLTGFYAIGGKTFITGMADYPGVNNAQKVFITEVVKDSPASREGIMAGDRIISVEGQNVDMDETVFMKVQEARKSGKEKIDVVLERNGESFSKNLSTYKEQVQAGKKTVEIERIGITMETRGKVQAAWYVAPIIAAQEELKLARLTIVGFGDFLAQIFREFKISENVGGPIAIVQMSGIAAQMGFAALIQFIIVISITLGVINILPFPALDGGHIFFLFLEKVIGREIPANVKDTINKIGFALLLLLIIAVTFKDIMRLF